MNEQKFDQKGNVYSKARPAYPSELLDMLREKNIVSKKTVVADIGSGTGIFTAQLAPLVKTVYAVEPNTDMCLAAKDSLKAFSNIISVNATAENTSLADNSVDLITVAQAFHWFDREKFKAECKRVLIPSGLVLLVWNDRDATSQIITGNFAVNRKYCPNFKGSSNGIDFGKSSFKDFFEGEYGVIEFDNSLFYDENAFVNRNLSSSYAPKQTDPNYIEYVEEIKSVFAKHSNNGTVKYPYITRCYIGRV